MVKNAISISTTQKNIKKIVDLTLLNPKKFDKMKMSTILHITKTNTTICIPMESDYYWLKVIQFVREKSKNWGNILSDDFISNEIKNLILELKTNKKKYLVIGKTVNKWIGNLKKIPVINFRFILPINNVDYRKDFDFGKVKLQKLTLTKLKKLAKFSNKIGHFSASNTLKDMIKFNKTEIYAILEIQAKDEEQGKILAELNLNRLIHAMRLFDPPSGITDRYHHYPETKYHTLVVNLDTDTFVDPFESIHLNAHIWRTKSYWKKINPYWNKLSKFLFLDNPNELQSIILTGLFWYGDAGNEIKDNLSKFLKYTYGLETLVIFDNKYDKKTRMAERLAKIFSKSNKKNFQIYKNLIQQYYDVRSGAIHAGKLIVDSEDVGTTNQMLSGLIFEYIKFSKKYSDVKTMFKKEFSITI